MAQNTTGNQVEDEELFGTSPDDDTLLGEDIFTSGGNATPNADSSKVTPASQAEQEAAKKAAQGESPEDKGIREAKEKKEAEDKLRQELEEEWNKEDPKNPKKGDKSKTSTEGDTTEDLEGFAEIAEGLYKIGIFNKESEDEEAPSNQDEFIDKFNTEIDNRVDQGITDIVSKYGDEYQELFDAIFVDGVSIHDYLQKYDHIQSFKQMDITDETNQVIVVKAALTKLGMDEKDIQEKIKALKLTSELESDAVRYQKTLIAQEEKELVLSQQKDKQLNEIKQRNAEQYTKSISTILLDKLKTKEFDGIPLTKDLAVKTRSFLDDKKWKLPSGELITDFDYAILELNKPQNHALKVKLGLLLASTFEPGKPINLDLGGIKKAAVSRENKEIFSFNRSKKIKYSQAGVTAGDEDPLKDF